jgi:hypothetical protein
MASVTAVQVKSLLAHLNSISRESFIRKFKSELQKTDKKQIAEIVNAWNKIPHFLN